MLGDRDSRKRIGYQKKLRDINKIQYTCHGGLIFVFDLQMLSNQKYKDLYYKHFATSVYKYLFYFNFKIQDLVNR